MFTIEVSRWLLAAGAGVFVTVGFDAVLHGLSHGGHGILNALWAGEPSQRSRPTKWVGGIFWHIIADLLLGIVLSILLAWMLPIGLPAWILSGVLLGSLLAITWVHVYATLEVGGRLAIGLGGLAILQVTIASIAIGLIYSV